jgi:hypothetical protein
MSHIKLQGLDITIETPKGRSRRPGWPPMKAHYGYFKRSEGADGDHVDCFVGPDKEADTVYVIDQVKPNGKFDECKCLIGFSSRESAIAAYRGSYTIGWRVGRVTPMKMADFKKWLQQPEKTKKPASTMLEKYSFNPEDHPRGQPNNAGQFVEKGKSVKTILFDKRGDTEFRQLPVRLTIDRTTLGTTVSVGKNGVVDVKSYMGSVSPTDVRNAIYQHFSKLKDEAIAKKYGPGFWRATNNAKEHELAASGALSVSMNHAEGSREAGLSVSNTLGYAGLNGYKGVYCVTGDVVGTGSDGEPVLDVKTVKHGKRYSGKSMSKLFEDDQKMLDSILADHGWTREQLNATPTMVSPEDFGKHLDQS